MIGGWLLLPPTSIPLPGFPDYDKVMAPVVGVTLGTLIFQPNRLLAFRPRWFDLSFLFWSLCPFISSLTNGLGLYDALSALLENLVRWTIPYLIGRLYFGDKEGMGELALGIALGGMIWVLPCLFEMRMSPILLPSVYGLTRFEGTRLGGWRPRVLLFNGAGTGDVDDSLVADGGLDLVVGICEAVWPLFPFQLVPAGLARHHDSLSAPRERRPC